MDWHDTKEQVRQATDIVELIGQYIPLRRQGRGYVGICPWHSDRRPSLTVNPERQSFKCWVCGDVGGDVYSFIMKMDALDFREALEVLAERAGISLSRPSGGSRDTPGGRRQLLQAMAWVEEQYHRYLIEARDAKPARDYLAQRRINHDSIERFRLGFAPDRWDWLIQAAASRDIAPALLERLGLVVSREKGGYYDRFRGRVLFPIRDVQARPIALGGRILPELARDDTAKYINSPETPLFSKSNQLYALDLAKRAINKQNNAIVVEGYTDCVAAHQEGVENVVAVLGTALGERHIQLLQRFADLVTLVLDGDEAGQRRTNEILELFASQAIDLRILTLPQDLDPCDFILAQGSAAFGQLLAGAQDALEHKIQTVTQGLDITSQTHAANAALEDVLATFARMSRRTSSSAQSLREHQFLSRLARQFRVDEAQLRSRIASIRQQDRRTPTESSADSDHRSTPPDLHAWDRELIEVILLRPDCLDQFSQVIALDDLQSDAGRMLYQLCLTLKQKGITPTFDRLSLEIEQPEFKTLLVDIDERSRAKTETEFDRRVEDLIRRFQHRKFDEENQVRIQTLASGDLEPQHAEQLLGDLVANLKSRQGRTEPTDG